MSWVTWEPKSRMRILSSEAGAAARPARAAPGFSIDVVIRRLLGDLHVVHMGFAHARRGDLDELGLGAHLLDGAAAGISHAGAKPAHELRDDRGRGALVRDAPLDALGHELVGVHFRV